MAPAPSTISCAGASRRRSTPALPQSTSPTRWATRCRRNITRCSRWCGSGCRTRTRRGSPCIATKPSLVLANHSARHAFVHKLEELGYKLSGNQLEDAFSRFKALADRKKHVYDDDIEALVDEEIATAQDRIKLVSLTVIAGTRGPQRATMKLDIDGRQVIEECEGNGPVDATFNAIKALVPHEVVLELYQVHAVTEGTDAQAEVSVRLAHEGRSMTSKGADPDTLVASAKAYLGALNKIVMKIGRAACRGRE